MEIAGLAFGAASLVGLYSACMETINRIESYRHYGNDKKLLLSRLDANKDIFQKWAKRVGISAEGLLEPHDTRLDDLDTARAVVQILTCIQDLLRDPSKGRDQSLADYAQNTHSWPKRHNDLSVRNESQTISRKRDKLAWSLQGKSKMDSRVLQLTRLVEMLDRLVPLYRNNVGGNVDRYCHVMSQKDLDAFLIGHDIDQRQKDEDRQTVLAWLSPVLSNGRYEACQTNRTKSTCSWIFENQIYQDWRSSQFPANAAKFLWLHGPAGFGKSYLCAAIVESLNEDEDLCVNYYFCASTSVNQDSPSAILRAWLARLVTRDDELLDLAYEMVRRSPSQASNTSLWELFERLIGETSNHVFVIDGLDQCQSGTSNDIAQEQTSEDRLGFLKQLQQSLGRIQSRVLIVSRDEPDLRSRLSSCGPYIAEYKLFEYEILRTDVSADTLTFSQDLVRRKLYNKSDTDQNEIAKQIARKCEGMFLWVDLQGRQLSGGKSVKKLLSTVEATPKALESVYKKSWETILSRPNDEKPRALNILRWATFAARPLTVAEITEALITPNYEEDEDLQLDELPDCYDDEYVQDRIIGLCASLVEIRPASDKGLESRTIHLRHFSIKEFMLSTDMCGILSDLVFIPSYDTAIPNNHLAVICLRYLLYEHDIVADTIMSKRKAFYDYAAQYWYQHISSAGNSYSTLIKYANEFLDPDNKSWKSWRLHCETFWQQQQHCPQFQVTNVTANPLYFAAEYGLKETVDHLHRNHSEMLNTPGGLYGTPLQAACYAGHSSLVMHLLGLGADVNLSAGFFGSALGAAADRGDLEICKHLLERNARMDLTGHCKSTIIGLAAEQGRLEVVRLLADLGASLNITDINGWSPVHRACSKGHFEVVNLLVDRNVDISIGTINGWTPLISVCRNGQLDVVKLLLDRGAEISVSTNDGYTPLIFACINGHFDIVEMLLDRQADTSIASNDGSTPLDLACFSGHLDIVKLLLDRQADISVVDNNRSTPLSSACSNGNFDIVRLLLDRGADLSVADNHGVTPLNMACHHRHLEVANLLLDRNADISTATDDGWTPLIAACVNGHLDTLELLLDRRVNISIADNRGFTPLHHACRNGHLDMIKLLLDRQADISAADDEGWTPLFLACLYGHLEVVEVLLDWGANTSVVNNEGWTPLIVVCLDGRLEVVKVLLDRGADISVASNIGWTPLNSACLHGHLEIVKVLLDRQADTSVADDEGWTPLISACHHGHIDVVKVLLDRQANVHAATNEGWTPVHSACNNGHLEIVQLLLKTSVDPDLTTKMGETGLHLACRRDVPEVANLLINHGYDPLMVDDYGRSCIDWASLYRPCISAIAPSISEAKSTPKDTSRAVLRSTIRRLTAEALSMSGAADSYRLGHCLSFAGDEPNACRAFAQTTTIEGSQVRHIAACNRCDPKRLICGMDRFICKSCVDLDLCQQCYEHFREDEKSWRCQSHEFLQVPTPGFVPLPETETLSWLKAVALQYS